MPRRSNANQPQTEPAVDPVSDILEPADGTGADAVGQSGEVTAPAPNNDEAQEAADAHLEAERIAEEQKKADESRLASEQEHLRVSDETYGKAREEKDGLTLVPSHKVKANRTVVPLEPRIDRDGMTVCKRK